MKQMIDADTMKIELITLLHAMILDLNFLFDILCSTAYIGTIDIPEKKEIKNKSQKEILK